MTRSTHRYIAIAAAACVWLSGRQNVQAEGPVVAPRPPASPAGVVGGRENFVGVFTQPVWSARLRGLGPLKQPSQKDGLLVTRVLAGSPAERAGLKPRDVIMAFDGRAVTSSEQFRMLIQSAKPAATVHVTCRRSNKTNVVRLVLGRRTVIATTTTGGAPGVETVSALVRWQRKLQRETSARPLREAAAKPPAPRSGLQSIPSQLPLVRPRQLLITSADGRNCEIRIQYGGAERKLTSRIGSTHLQMQSDLAGLPADLRKDVSAHLVRLTAEAGKKKTVRCRFLPCLHSTAPALRIMVAQPVNDRGVRIVEIDKPLTVSKPVTGRELLRFEPFARELRSLSPAVRKRVTETLLNTRLAPLRVDVTRSQ